MQKPSLALALLLAAGCSRSPAADAPAIYGGSPDDEHDAVVALAERGETFCTATIVRVSGSTGYALTAAHCLEGRRSPRGLTVVQGDDSRGRGRVVYPVERFATHPDYDDQAMTDDLAMIQFSGATAQTPVIEAAQPSDDRMRRGDEVLFVGYGATDRSEDNSRRNEVRGSIASLSEGTFSYGQRRGGPCFGDSGGPALASSGGKLVVVGVTSYGDGGCHSRGTSMRVSSAYNGFIAPFFDPQQAPAQRPSAGRPSSRPVSQADQDDDPPPSGRPGRWHGYGHGRHHGHP